MRRAALGGASLAETILADSLPALFRFANTYRRANCGPIDKRDRVCWPSQSGARAGRRRRRRGHPLRRACRGMAELPERRPNWAGSVRLGLDAGHPGPLCLQSLASSVRAGRLELPPPFGQQILSYLLPFLPCPRGASRSTASLRVQVARSRSRVWKLCTGRPSAASLLARLRSAAVGLQPTGLSRGEGWAGAPIEARSRAAAMGSSS